MADFYEILGVSQSANSAQIKAAYKKLAMQYHPDHNPGNPQAEEMFKAINEAYHVLSDPLKKSRYDSRFYVNITPPSYAEARWQATQREQFVRWQQAQKKRYVFDGHYFKIQGLAFLVFLVMSGICFAIIHTAGYFIDSKYEKIRLRNLQLVNEVNVLFGSGKIDEAITQIMELHEREPLEFQFINARDSLVNELRVQAEKNFTTQNYNEALRYFECLHRFEFPPRSETLRKIGVCKFNMGSYEDALQTLKQLHTQQPWNLELIYQIGVINFKYLNNNEEALYYFTMGTRLFKENLTEIYGEAFTVVMDPKDVPDIYADIFVERSYVNMALKNYRDALKDLNWAVYLRPMEGEYYKLRAIAKAKSRRNSLLCSDLLQAKKLGAQGVSELQKMYCQ